MVTIGSLWLAILLSAVIVWIVSALIWTVLPHHKKDFKGLPDEASVRNALKPQNLAPGQYTIPYAADANAMKDPEVQGRFQEGPVGILTVMAPGVPSMGKNMGLAFVYYLVVGLFVAYVASRHLPAGAEYLSVHRLASVVAFMAYGFGIVQDAIWFGRPWGFSFKVMIDALVCGLMTGGVFGWLWPS